MKASEFKASQGYIPCLQGKEKNEVKLLSVGDAGPKMRRAIKNGAALCLWMHLTLGGGVGNEDCWGLGADPGTWEQGCTFLPSAER